MDSLPSPLELTAATEAELQETVDLMAALVDVPVGLIMQVLGDEISVAISSRTEGNPYAPGDKEHLLDSGLYCETVINTRDQLLVPDALSSARWKDNPDVKLDMISYLGFPIRLPDGSVFGTICVLDNRPNAYDDAKIRLVKRFGNLAERLLESVYMNAALGDENRRLQEYLDEIRVLREFVPICSHCKAVRDEDGVWGSVEKFLVEKQKLECSHGICPACLEKHYADLDV